MSKSENASGAHVPCIDLLSSPLNHLVVLHRVLYGTIDEKEALGYLHSHLRDDADLADLGRPLKYQYKDNADAHGRRSRTVQPLVGSLDSET